MCQYGGLQNTTCIKKKQIVLNIKIPQGYMFRLPGHCICPGNLSVKVSSHNFLRRSSFYIFQKNELKVKNHDRLAQYQYSLKLYKHRKGNVTFKDILGISIRDLHH